MINLAYLVMCVGILDLVEATKLEDQIKSNISVHRIFWYPYLDASAAVINIVRVAAEEVS